MYNHSTIISCLRGLIGFEQPYDTEIPAIDEDLKESSSGIYVSHLHPLLTYPNIMAIAEHFERTSVRVWSSTVAYKVGEVIKASDDKYYRSIQAETNQDPTTETDYWTETTLLSAFLRRVYDNSSRKLVNTVFTDKKIRERGKSLITDVNLHEGVGNFTGRITKTGRLCGFKLTLKNPDTVAILQYIGLQVDTAQANVQIYLYHSSNNEAVKIFTINQTKSIAFQWTKITAETLAYMSDTINPGGHYYLCYYEDQLNGEMIRKDINYEGKVSCGTCEGAVTNSMLHGKWSPFLSVQPFYVEGDNLPADEFLWEEDDEVYVSDTNWGLNLQISVQCDVSAVLCGHTSTFINALSQQLVVDLLTEMSFSLRDNQMKERIAGLAAVALDNQENGMNGEAKKLIDEITALSFDFSGMSKLCIPCGNGMQSKIKSVW